MAVAEWFFVKGTKEAGPFTLGQIQSLFSSGSITEETYLWRPGCADWMPLSAFAEFPPASPQPRAGTAWQCGMTQPVTPQRGAVMQNEASALTNAQWVDETPHPWRRYFARYLDYLLWMMVMMLLIGIGLAFLDQQMLGRFIDFLEQPVGIVVQFILAFILAMIPNAILIGLTGGNLGKWLFGICVLDETERPMGISRALKREIRIFFYGLGLGIPIVTLITMFIAYQKLKEDGSTSWDQALGLRVVQRKNGLVQYIGNAVGIVLLVALIGMARFLETL